MQREQNRFLRHKGLDGVGAQNLGRQVHLPKAHALNGDWGHAQLGSKNKTRGQPKHKRTICRMRKVCRSPHIHAGLCGFEMA
jgi:hypothetical protein